MDSTPTTTDYDAQLDRLRGEILANPTAYTQNDWRQAEITRLTREKLGPRASAPGVGTSSVVRNAPPASPAPAAPARPAAPAKTPPAAPKAAPEYEMVPGSSPDFEARHAQAERMRVRELDQRLLALREQIYAKPWAREAVEWQDELTELTREKLGEAGKRNALGDDAHAPIAFEPARPGDTFRVALPDAPAGKEWDASLVQPLLDEGEDLHALMGQALPTIAQDIEAVLTLISAETPTTDTPEAAFAAFIENSHGGDQAAAMAALADAQFFIKNRTTPSQRAWLEQTGWGDDPRLIELVAKYGKPLRAELAQAHAAREDPNGPLRKPGHPDYAAAEQAQRKRYQRAFGRRPVARVS